MARVVLEDEPRVAGDVFVAEIELDDPSLKLDTPEDSISICRVGIDHQPVEAHHRVEAIIAIGE